LKRLPREAWRDPLLQDRAGRAYSVLRRHVLCWRMAYRDEHAARFDQRPGPILRLATNGIHDDIHLMGHLLKGCRVVIDHDLSSERTNKLHVLEGRSADHVSAFPACQLDRVVAHTARRAMDKYLLPGLQLAR